jgi:hypothetical protein
VAASDGAPVTVVSVVPTGQEATVHNLHVAGLHSYYVVTTSGIPVAVHNKCTDPRKEIEEIAQEEAKRGRKALLSTLTVDQQEAAKKKSWLEDVFTGHAVHNRTNKVLQNRYPGEFEYNPSNGVDFKHVDPDTKVVTRIELTTSGQVEKHIARGGEYETAQYATYELPRPGT